MREKQTYFIKRKEKHEGKMRKQDLKDVAYSYSYVENNKFITKLCAPKIMEKLPKITLALPKIDLCQNFELSFC